MVSILRTEFFRLKKSALFWALLFVCALLPAVSVLINYLSVKALSGMDMGVEFDVWEYIKTVNVTGEVLSALPRLTGDSLFALICTSIFLTKEFSDGTYRNILLANRSRRELYHSFLVMALTVGASYFVASYVSTILFNAVVFGFGTMVPLSVVTACVIAFAMGMVSVVFLQSMTCMFLFVSRKLSVALVCPLVISILAPTFIYSFVEVFAEYGIISSMDMTWIPLYNLNLLDLTNIDGALIGKIFLYLIPLSVLFYLLGWASFKKADLK